MPAGFFESANAGDVTALFDYSPLIGTVRSRLTHARDHVYGECMAGKTTTTVRLDAEDAEALARARADGHSASELIRKGLRVIAARYYRRRRPPTTGLFVSTSTKLGDESELFRDIEE